MTVSLGLTKFVHSERPVGSMIELLQSLSAHVMPGGEAERNPSERRSIETADEKQSYDDVQLRNGKVS